MSDNNGNGEQGAPPDTSKFTPTEQRMLAVLSDGLTHTTEELHGCLSDELAAISAVRVRVAGLRKKLNRIGQDIVCRAVPNMRRAWQHVRLLASATDGKR